MTDILNYLADTYKIDVIDILFHKSFERHYIYVDKIDGKYRFNSMNTNFTEFGFESESCFYLEDIFQNYCIDTTVSKVFGAEKTLKIFKEAFLDYLTEPCKQSCIKYIPLRFGSGHKWVRIELAKVDTPNGEYLLCGMISDAFRYGGEKENAIALSYFDSLTGLFNRNTLKDHLNNIEPNENKYFIYIDLNNFKEFNDTYGHHFGDLVLKTFANTLLETCNDKICAYRMSGDEFFLTTKDMSEKETLNHIHHIENILKNINIGNIDTTIEFSYGYAHISEPERLDFNTILRETDIKMYDHKNKIKNEQRNMR